MASLLFLLLLPVLLHSLHHYDSPHQPFDPSMDIVQPGPRHHVGRGHFDTHILKWSSDIQEVIRENGPSMNVSRNQELVIKCKKVAVPMILRLVKKELSGECKEVAHEVGYCPDPNKYIHLRSYTMEPGEYVLTSYSDRSNTQRESGGLCAEGLVYPITISKDSKPAIPYPSNPDLGKMRDQMSRDSYQRVLALQSSTAHYTLVTSLLLSLLFSLLY